MPKKLSPSSPKVPVSVNRKNGDIPTGGDKNRDRATCDIR